MGVGMLLWGLFWLLFLFKIEILSPSIFLPPSIRGFHPLPIKNYPSMLPEAVVSHTLIQLIPVKHYKKREVYKQLVKKLFSVVRQPSVVNVDQSWLQLTPRKPVWLGR